MTRPTPSRRPVAQPVCEPCDAPMEPVRGRDGIWRCPDCGIEMPASLVRESEAA